ncbi:MAG TPA: protein kinase [Gemmataceae bacterium]|nr:protein kinase [Gemmataceae bacterium]
MNDPQGPHCPDVATLGHLLASSLDEPSLSETRLHVSGCAGCRAALDTLSGTPGEQSGLKAPGPDIPKYMQEPALRRLMDRLIAGRESHAPADDLAFLLDPPGHGHEGDLGVLGPYRILAELGRGGMGVVLRGYDDKLQRAVAIKVLRPGRSEAEAKRRFAREARAAASLDHENVIGVFAVEEWRGQPAIVMPCIQGESLQERLRRDGALPLAEVVRIAKQIAEGLAAAHERGLVHRDVKPANILLERRPGADKDATIVKITDFGLAQIVDEASLTESGVIVGTPQYMAPEQASGEPADYRADLFSLGSVIYEMCTGQPPFRSGLPLATLKRVCEDDPIPASRVNPRVPQWLSDMIHRLLAKKPEDRFQSGRDVAKVLAAGSYVPPAPVRSAVQGRAGGDVGPRAPSSPPAVATRRARPRLLRATLLTVLVGSGVLIWSFAVTGGRRPAELTKLDSHGPFKILDATGVAYQVHPTLAAALAATRPDDIIEIAGNGPFPCPAIDQPYSHPLTIRAALGFHPVIELQPGNKGVSLFATYASLTLEGLELLYQPPARDLHCTLIRARPGSTVRIVNCRILVKAQGFGVGLENARNCEIRNSQLLADNAWAPVGIFGPNKVTIVNSVIANRGEAIQIETGKPFGYIDLDLDGNTLFGREVFRVTFKTPVPLDAETISSGRKLNIRGKSNVMIGTTEGKEFLSVSTRVPVDVWAPDAVARALRQGTDLQSEGDWHAARPSFLSVLDPNLEEHEVPAADLPEWDAYFAAGKVVFPGTFRFSGGNLFNRVATEVENLRPGDFRLEQGSPGKGAGLKDAGADVDFVGPGAAYDRWRLLK